MGLTIVPVTPVFNSLIWRMCVIVGDGFGSVYNNNFPNLAGPILNHKPNIMSILS